MYANAIVYLHVLNELHRHMWHGVFPVDSLKLLNLFADKRHNTDPGENVLSAQPLARHAIGECLGVLVARLAQVAHKQACVCTETLFRLALLKSNI